ncbi:hypothetical protein [Flavobacterium sp. LM4]|uniref:hypothetical protein n=1 Tax=Flavobacterium sp. LM4 TaxID=1938609 RepID=UPI0009929304|nr:hypothetical protein [Flavobacterium sp. LM4]OOV17596.1 hypothetical protein BXU10_16090 [Flavobacterium sp. LM4]
MTLEFLVFHATPYIPFYKNTGERLSGTNTADLVGGKINYARQAASKAVSVSKLQNKLTANTVLLNTETTY